MGAVAEGALLVLIHRHGGRAPHSARDYVRAFDLVSVSAAGVTVAWAFPAIQPVPIKLGGVRPRQPARSSATLMPTGRT
jgi:hypothetical protein